MSDEPDLEVQRLHSGAELPLRAYGESAAWDLSALCEMESGRSFTTTIAPQSTVLVRTGLALRAPLGSVVLICSRSGMAAKQSVFVANAPGVVDPDYTGEIKVALHNASMVPFYVKNGDRIAQALILPLTVCRGLRVVEALPQTERGDKGFGSSGL